VIARAVLERDVVILACAISAGIHAALVPSHLEEGHAAAGGFAVSAALLAALAVAITRSARPLLFAAAWAVFAGLIAGYALAVTTGVPVLHPRPEPVEGLGVFTKAVELLGLLAAAHLLPHPRLIATQPKGIAT
jgi:hypothetical protein